MLKHLVEIILLFLVPPEGYLLLCQEFNCTNYFVQTVSSCCVCNALDNFVSMDFLLWRLTETEWLWAWVNARALNFSIAVFQIQNPALTNAGSTFAFKAAFLSLQVFIQWKHKTSLSSGA